MIEQIAIPSTRVINSSRVLANNSPAMEWPRVKVSQFPPNALRSDAFPQDQDLNGTNTLLYPGTFANGERDMGYDSILIHPFCEGGPGSNFLMRVYGWSAPPTGIPTTTNGGQVVNGTEYWWRFLLAEFDCTAGISNGGLGAVPIPTDMLSGQLLSLAANEFFCDTVRLTAGRDLVVSPATGLPQPQGVDFDGRLLTVAYPPVPDSPESVGYAVVKLLGCQFFTFAFKQGYAVPAFGNAFWSPI